MPRTTRKNTRKYTANTSPLEEPILIGSGGFGQVYKPPLRCEKPLPEGETYDGKVSKILLEKHAEVEFKDFIELHKKIDPLGEFTLAGSKQIICNPDYGRRTQNALSKFREKDLHFSSGARLILMQDAGESLSKLVKRFGGPEGQYVSSASPMSKLMRKTARKSTNANANPKIDWSRFFAEAVFMFKGVEALLSKNFLHSDLKPQNIMFDRNTNTMTMIDFGLMKPFKLFNKRLRTSSLKSTFHFSYPFEYFFMTRENFDKIVNREIPYSMRRLDSDLRKKFNEAFFSFISYSDNSPAHSMRLNNDIDSFFAKMAALRPPAVTKRATRAVTHNAMDDQYEALLEKFRNCFDSYGLGFSLQYVLVRARKYIKNENLCQSLYELFYSMYTPDLFERVDIFTAKKKYLNILDQYGIAYSLQRNNGSGKKRDGSPIRLEGGGTRSSPIRNHPFGNFSQIDMRGHIPRSYPSDHDIVAPEYR